MPIVDADIRVDHERASGNGRDDKNDADGASGLLDKAGSTADDGVPVRTADANDDRRRSSDKTDDKKAGVVSPSRKPYPQGR
ncbi:hypothetical protein [Terrabacter sp. C0L_2]|uniref:hypothetical protein n=1 Tax=Terrabacter sp. C0L_2 TaxID=3108389 RepID=UPI002ED48026|nr:hypothetical protein U5C87_22415 [Terrabacter sp. C0L_2]